MSTLPPPKAPVLTGNIPLPPPAVAKPVMPSPPAEKPASVVPPPPTALQHVEAWWQETKDSAPPPHQKAFVVHAEQAWDKLVERLKEL